MKLNIGGLKKKEGWKLLNIQEGPNIDFVGDLRDLSQFKDESIEEIYASHVVEHIGIKKALNSFKEVNRVLKKNGKFYISVPDMDVLCHFFLSPLANKKVKFEVMRIMFGGQIDDFDFHYFGWNFEFLEDFLTNANFSEIKKVRSLGIFNDTSEHKLHGVPISLNVIATK
jgi:predicted SAM-dependent methyltransferase|tara:strand:+ start:590 stop:1099 length:510 start_codon:yes stop_codon:yes gene_type:complete